MYSIITELVNNTLVRWREKKNITESYNLSFQSEKTQPCEDFSVRNLLQKRTCSFLPCLSSDSREKYDHDPTSIEQVPTSEVANCYDEEGRCPKSDKDWEPVGGRWLEDERHQPEAAFGKWSLCGNKCIMFEVWCQIYNMPIVNMHTGRWLANFTTIWSS